MARVKQTARKGPAKKKSGADKRRSPRIATQNELKDCVSQLGAPGGGHVLGDPGVKFSSGLVFHVFFWPRATGTLGQCA